MKEKIEVMHFVSRFETGGMENGVVNICNRLDRGHFQASLCCLKGLGNMVDRLKPDVKVYNMNFKEGKDLFRFLVLSNFLRQTKPDIVHTHGLAGGSFDCIVGARLGNVDAIINGEHGGFCLKKHQILVQRFLSRLSTVNLSVSQGLKNEIVAKIGISPERISVISNGVDLGLFNGKQNIDDLRKEIFDKSGIALFKENRFIIGSIGSLKPCKNQTLLLKAIVRINKSHPDNDILVLLIGDGIDRCSLEKFVKENKIENKVLFLGIRKDIPALLSLVDILISTSLPSWEGLSNVLLEAMSSGKPVIATRSIGNEELIIDGVNGYFYDGSDVDSLVEKINFLMNNYNLLKKMGESAINSVVNGFSLEKMVNNYENLYSDLYIKRKK